MPVEGGIEDWRGTAEHPQMHMDENLFCAHTEINGRDAIESDDASKRSVYATDERSQCCLL